MRPRKNNFYHSWERLNEFVPVGESKKVGPKATLHNTGTVAVIEIKDKRVVAIHFTSERILLPVPAWRARADIEQIVNPIINGFGWYWGRIIYGPHAKKHYGLKPTNVTPGTVECDLRSVVPPEKNGLSITWTGKVLNWNGESLKNQSRLTNSQVKKALESHEKRSRAQKRVREFAYLLGFPNTAKMGGFKLPKNKDTELANRLNEVSRTLGYLHVAHAWACGVNVLPQDEREIEMYLDGIGRLVAEPVDTSLKWSVWDKLYERNASLWLRQRPLSSEEYQVSHR